MALGRIEKLFRLVAQYEGEDLFKQFTGVLVVDGLEPCFMELGEDGKNKGSRFHSALASVSDTAMDPRGVFIIPCCTATVTAPVAEFFAISHRRRVFLPVVASLAPPTMKKNGTVTPVF